MGFHPHEKTLKIFYMQARQLLIEKLKRELEDNGTAPQKQSPCLRSSNSEAPGLYSADESPVWEMTAMVYFCLFGNQIDIFPWLPGAIRKRASKTETIAHFSKKWGHMSIEYR